MKHRRFKKRDKGQYWFSDDTLSQKFDSLIVVRYKEDHHIICKSLESKDDCPIVLDLEVKSQSVVSVNIVQKDRVCAPLGYEYSVLRYFLLNTSERGEDGKPSKFNLDVMKSSYVSDTKCTTIEANLKPGLYRLVCDVDSTASEFAKLFNITVYSEKKMMVHEQPASESLRLHSDLMSNLCIQRGEKTNLSEDGSIRKYILESRKLGFTVVSYVNRSENTYNLVEQMSQVPDPARVKVSKLLEDEDKVVFHLSSNTRKHVLYRYDPSDSVDVSVKQSTCKVKS